MGLVGETVSKWVWALKEHAPSQLVPTVPLEQAATPALVKADQDRSRDAYWQVMNEVIMERMKRDLEFALNTQELGSISPEAFKSEILVQSGGFWMPYLNPEKRREIELAPVALTRRETAEGLTLPEKKRQRLERKAYLKNRERKINWLRGIDKFTWKRLNNRFFLESKGILMGDIDEELSKGFLETFDRDEEMYNFLLGVGWNQTLVDIFDFRSSLVDEAREILSQRLFGKHFDEIKESEDKVNTIKHAFGWGDAEGTKKFGNTRDLMRAVRIAQGVEADDPDPKNQPKALGLINEKLLADAKTTKLTSFGRAITSAQQQQLNNRAEVLFGDQFLNLTNEEQIMVAAGPGTILSLEEIMDWISDYQVPDPYDDTKASLIRIESVDLEYAYWTRLGWVSMIGPWRLADRINKIIFGYAAREDQNTLQRPQVEGAATSGFGKYVYFDWDYWEAFHGGGGEGKRKVLLEGTVNKVEWAHGFLQEYQAGQVRAFNRHKEDAEKENKARVAAGEPLKRIVDFEEFSYGMLPVGSYKGLAKEWFVSGWRLIAEGTYMKLRGDAVEQGARRGATAEQIDETLDGDVMGQKLTYAGKEVLVKRYLDAKRTVFLDVVEMFRCWGDKTGHKTSRFREALGDLFFDKFLIDFMLKPREPLGIVKTSWAGILNFIWLGSPAISNLFVSKAVLFPFTIGNWAFKGFEVGGGLGAAWPWLLAWLTVSGGIAWAQDKLILRKGVGEKKWVELQKKMNEKFKALAENPQRTMIESGWDPERASVDTHEPIKII